jgi:hypothetical protein
MCYAAVHRRREARFFSTSKGPTKPSTPRSIGLMRFCNWFTEGFDTADLKEAKALLGALAS